MIRHFMVRFRRLYGVAVLLCSLAVAVPAWAQFETRTTFVVPGAAVGTNIAIGDFNHDGKLDLALTLDRSLSILLGNGDGTFRQSESYPGVFYSVVAADFNNDGNLDLVVAPDADSISVFLGNGDGTFQSPISSPTTYACGFVSVGDFNGDGKVDLVVSDYLDISVLLGNGDGTFQPPVNNNSFAAPGQLAVGDFNNDHRLDVAAVGTFGGSSYLGVLLGNGDGTLQDALTYSLSDPPGSIAAADFGKNGKLDVAIGAYFGDGVVVLLGTGEGGFGAPRDYPGGGPVLVQDFNQDGNLDIVSGIVLLLNNGNGTFREPPAAGFRPVGPVSAGLEAAGDLNGDGLPDVVLLDSEHQKITIMLNTGALAFSPTTPLNFGEQLIGTTSKPQIVTIRNTGSRAISFHSLRASGPFEATDTCGGAIAAGATCKISATFTPTTAGPQSGTIAILDGASSKPQYVELTGAGKQ
jgi:hypothetical protein